MSKCLLLVVLVITLSGCGGTVTLPVQDADGREVALLQHARHSSLVLTRADHTRVRYAYGDWAWYVEQETGPISGVRALFLPSRSALGRAEQPAVRHLAHCEFRAGY